MMGNITVTRPIPVPTELVGLIFDHVEAEGGDKPLADLATLARSCRAFTGEVHANYLPSQATQLLAEPALKRLWKVQVTLVPLIQCMPEDLWVCREVAGNSGQSELVFRRAMKETDWTRFEYYQCRIHQLGLRSNDPRYLCLTTSIHPDVFRALTTYRPARKFLPNLQHWVINHRTEKLLLFADAFVGPRLKHVVSQFDYICDYEVQVSTLFLSLARLSVNLQSLEFKSYDADEFYNMFFDLITHLPNLRRLDIPSSCIRSEVLDYLSSLPFLESLSQVTLGDRDRNRDIPFFATQNGSFPSLRELSISASNYTPVLALLKVLQRPLQSLTIEIEIDEDHHGDHFESTLSTLKEVFSTLGKYHCTSLRKLVMSECPPFKFGAPKQAAINALAPLFSFRSLENLSLETSISLYLDDAWLAQAAEFWPFLSILQSLNGGQAPGISCFTLKGIIPLIKGCPQLSILKIPLNLTPVAISSFAGVSNSRIECVHAARGSQLAHPLQVFRSLVTMFPNLTTLVPGGYDKRWQNLCNLLSNSSPVEVS